MPNRLAILSRLVIAVITTGMVGCSPSLLQPSNMTLTETSIPTTIQTSEPPIATVTSQLAATVVMPTPTPKASDVHGTDVAFPVLTLGQATSEFVGVECAAGQAPGRVFKSSYPYQEVTQLSPEDGAIYFNPQMGRNTNDVAAVRVDYSVDALDPLVAENATLTEYPDSDTIVVFGENSSLTALVDSGLSRIEATDADGRCTVAQGIFDILGWTSGNTILYRELLRSGNLQLVAYDLTANTKTVLLSNIGTAVMSWHGESLVAWDVASNQVVVRSTRVGTEVPVNSYSLPQEFSVQDFVSGFSWTGDGEILVAIRQRQELALALLSVSDGQWRPIGEMRDAIPRALGVDNGFAIMCVDRGEERGLFSSSLDDFEPVLRFPSLTLQCRGAGIVHSSDGSAWFAAIDSRSPGTLALVAFESDRHTREISVSLPDVEGYGLVSYSFGVP